MNVPFVVASTRARATWRSGIVAVKVLSRSSALVFLYASLLPSSVPVNRQRRPVAGDRAVDDRSAANLLLARKSRKLAES